MIDEDFEDVGEPVGDFLDPPAPIPLVGSRKRFQVTTSAVGGTLAAVAHASLESDEAVADVYREVAQRILSNGYLSLTEAAEVLEKKHTGRALEKLMENLPLVAFASSRKGGWLLFPKNEEQYGNIQMLIQRITEQAETITNFGNLSAQDFANLTTVCSPSEKLLLRYLLIKIYGIDEAASRFDLAHGILSKDLQRVTEALSSVEALEPAEHNESTQSASVYKCQKAFHDALQQEQHGGCKAWEKDPTTRALTLALAEEAVRAVILIYSYVYSMIGGQDSSKSKQ